MFQSTRPRGARRWFGKDFVRVAVSIHAPTRGATPSVNSFRRSECVSIHAPTRGATLTPLWIARSLRFQSTRPRGARLRLVGVNSLRNVSIHAPTRGATLVKLLMHR